MRFLVECIAVCMAGYIFRIVAFKVAQSITGNIVEQILGEIVGHRARSSSSLEIAEVEGLLVGEVHFGGFSNIYFII